MEYTVVAFINGMHRTYYKTNTYNANVVSGCIELAQSTGHMVTVTWFSNGIRHQDIYEPNYNIRHIAD